MRAITQSGVELCLVSVMKNFLLSILFVLLSSSFASAQSSTVRGDGALANIDHLSKDGCIHTVAELVLLKSSAGAELASGIYVTGSQEDVCLGTGNGFATFLDARPQIVGLRYARYQGTVVAESYSGGAPLTFEIDLTWYGKGRITSDRNVWDDEGVVSFTYNAEREASIRGSVRADGVVMPVATAKLVRQVSGTVTR